MASEKLLIHQPTPGERTLLPFCQLSDLSDSTALMLSLNLLIQSVKGPALSVHKGTVSEYVREEN